MELWLSADIQLPNPMDLGWVINDRYNCAGGMLLMLSWCMLGSDDYLSSITHEVGVSFPAPAERKSAKVAMF